MNLHTAISEQIDLAHFYTNINPPMRILRLFRQWLVQVGADDVIISELDSVIRRNGGTYESGSLR